VSIGVATLSDLMSPVVWRNAVDEKAGGVESEGVISVGEA
jgi:hypothetical protein